jgi:putative hemolysin
MSRWLIVTILWVAALGALLTAGMVASYLRLLMRRLTPVSARQLFPTHGHRIQVDRERAGVSISTLHGVAMHLFALGVFALLILRRPQHFWSDLGTAVILVLGAIAIFDQLIPFLLVARHDEPEVILERHMPLLRWAVRLALPLTFPILISTSITRLLESADPEPEPPKPPEALQELIEAGEEAGLLKKGEGKMLQSVVEFREKVVREVMTPRPEIAALEINSPVAELRQLFRKKRLTRYPVYSAQLNNIEGIVNVRDLMELPPEEQARVTLRSLVRPVPFVPETKRIQELLKELQQSTTQMAIVVDEYGLVAGVVTVEDLVEEIVGEIRDEVEPHAQDIVKESSGTYLVAGNTEIAQLADQLHLDIEPGDYSTLAGLVLTELGHLPVPGEKVEKDGLALQVLEANQRTVLKLRLRILSSLPPAASSHA